MLRADGYAANVAVRAATDTTIARLARRAVRRGDRTLDILLLSGGGQNGAYGIGFLRGWRDRKDAPLPRFDLVTGISTGALQSPFALLGTHAALDTAAALYRSAETRVAPKINWFFWLRKTGGVVKTGRFERAIRGALDARMQADLNAEFRADRQIAVGTADFDLGLAHTWDFATEMDSTAAGLARQQEILLAATSIPGIFPPVLIDGHLHADGGTIHNLLPVLDLAGYRSLATALRGQGVIEPVTVRVWVVLNLFTHVPTVVMKPSSRAGMNRRTTQMLYTTQQPQLLARLNELASAVSTGVPGLRMELRMTAIPPQLASDPAAATMFDAPWMQRLEALGYARALSDAPWDAMPSEALQPAPVALPGEKP